MTLIIPQDYAAVVQSLRWSGDPEPMAVTYGVSIDTVAPPVDPAALASGLQARFAADILPLMASVITLNGCEVRWQNAAPPAPPVIAFDPGSAAGGNVGTYLPQNSAFLVHKRTSFAGRVGRGRLYFPGVNEDQVNNNGTLDGAALTSWNTALNTWLSDILVVPGCNGMVLLHDDGGAGAALPPYAISTLQMDPVIATQRQRLRR